MKKLILYISAVFLMTSCFQMYTTTGFPSVKNNVCKTLSGRTVFYAIFVDSEKTHPWSEYDMLSTLDSIQKASQWLEQKAMENNIILDIEVHHPDQNRRIPVNKALRYKTLAGTLFRYRDLRRGIDLVDEWSDDVSKRVARFLPRDTSGIILTKNKMSDRERLIAKLRDIYKTDNVAVLYFINNYYEDEISVALHNSSDDKTEYAVVSSKEPSVIAHEFLHLFGALDLYISPFDRGFGVKRKKNKLMKMYENEIMAFPYRRLDSLSISPLTRYLIGWDNALDADVASLISNRRTKFIKY